LEDGDELGGFTVREFRAFWFGLLRWSAAVLGIYMEATLAGRPHYDHLPTQYVPRPEFVSRMVELSGLSEDKVVSCLDRLNFGRDCPDKPDPYLQPLLCTATHVVWSPHLVQISKYERNILKLSARISSLKPIADNLIGNQERVLVREFGLLLGQHGYQFKTRIPLPGGQGEIDLLAYHDRYPEELLVVEAKAFLGVDEVAEVAQATNEMAHGQEQLERAVGTLKGMPVEGRRRLWTKPNWQYTERFFGIVLTPNSQPNATYSHSVYPAVTLETVRRYFARSDYKPPQNFWKAAVEKRWLAGYRECARGFRPVKVGSLTYELPVFFK
jgi:hypothetical protein